MINTVNPLPAPDLPQMTPEYTISLDDLNAAGGVFVRIQQYEDAARGDYIVVKWDEGSADEVLIDDLSSQFPIVTVVTKNLEVGPHSAYFIATDVSGNKGTSIVVNVNIIDGEPGLIYPAPVFIDAISGSINQDSIIANSGTHIYIAPSIDIISGDTVTLFWKGSNASGDVTEDGVFRHVILTNDINTGVSFLIPENNLYSLGNKGSVTASYQVKRNGTVMGVSTSSNAILDLNRGSMLAMVISTGATNTDYNAVHLHPFNQGVVKGPAGATVILSTVGGALFDESGTNNYQSVVNESGEISFRLRSDLQINTVVNAEATSSPGANIQQTVRFGPYTKGNGNIQYLNNSTGAPANGLTPCSVYLKTAHSSDLRGEITVVRVKVSGSAVVDGYSSNSADILLNSDKSAAIDIINSVAETVNVELSLPESSGSVNRLSLIFKSI